MVIFASENVDKNKMNMKPVQFKSDKNAKEAFVEYLAKGFIRGWRGVECEEYDDPS